MAFNQGVYDFVVANLNSPQTIIDAMIRFGVNVDQLSDAIGMPVSQVTNYFNNAGLQAPGMGYQEPGVDETAFIEQPSEPVVQAPAPQPEVVAPVVQPASPVEAQIQSRPIETPAPELVPAPVNAGSNIRQAVQNAAYTVVGEQGNDIAYNDITINGKTYSVINPTTIVRKSDDQSGMTGKMTRYEYLDPDTGESILDVQVDGGAFQAIMPLLVTVGTAAFPGLAQVIGTALGATGATATAIGGAVIQAATSVAAGADPATAIRNAAIGAGVGQLTSGLTGNSLVDSVVRSGATAALTGGDVGSAIINSVIANGAQQTLSGASLTGDTALDSGLVSAATSVAQALATGGDVTESAIQGFIGGSTAAINKPQTPTQVAGTQTTVGGGAATDTTAPSVTTGGLGTTLDVGMDTAVSGAQDDVLGIVAQEQEADRVASASQVLQAPGQMQKVTAEDAAILGLTPLYEQYQGPNGTLYMRDINTGKITQVLPQGAATNVAGGSVFLDKPQVIGAIEALPANALYQGILYAGDPNLIGKQLTANDLASLSISTERDTNVLPVGNLVVTQNADGTVTQRDKATGDTATIDASGNIVSQTKSLYTRFNDVANSVTGTTQSGLAELGASLAAEAQQFGLDTQNLIEAFQSIQAAGERMRPEEVNRQARAFIDEIYRVASDPNSTSKEIGLAILNSAANNPAGAAAVIGKELSQELPALLLRGRLAIFLGGMALNVAESAGAQALQKIDELKVTNPNATPQELARMARQDAAVAGAVTAAIGLIPGVNNVLARTLIEPFLEGLEEGSIEYITTGDANAAKGKAVLGAVIGGKTAAAINTGEELATAVQNNFGVKVPGGVAATPGASITVTAPSLPADTTVDPGVDLTPDNLGTLPTTLPDVPEFEVASEAPTTGVVVAVDANNNQASVIDDTGALTVVPANGLTPGQTTVLPAAPVVTTPSVPASTTPVVTETAPPVATEPTVTDGVVLQDNGDGTSLVLTQDGGATNVPSVDASTGLALAPGTSVTVDTSNNTATATGTDTSTATSAETTASADTGATTGTGATTETATGAETAADTGTVTDTATGVDTQTGTQTGVDTTTTQTQTQTQPETGTQTEPETVTQVTPEPLPQINTEEPEPTQPEDLITNVPEPEPTPEDQLLQQIIKELEKPTVPETPEPPPIEPPPFTPPESVVETPPVTVEQRLTVSPKTVRPTVMPGSRVEETAQILPLRPGLSEGGTGGIEGTPEEEQQPVWNVRSLKLRRLLGI